MKYQLFILLLISSFFSKAEIKSISLHNTVDSICVQKSAGRMTLFICGKAVKTYSIAVGQNPLGHKVKQGDNRTPEGLYYINDKNPNSSYYKNLGISYPNAQDRARAKMQRLDPGGDIKVHGYVDRYGSARERNTRYDATWGCIGVSNAEMDEIYDWVQVGARIHIFP